MQLLKLVCASCSAPLDISQDTETFACAYCGTTQRVERSGGIVSLRKVEGALKAVQRGTDRTAAELAIPRLTRELAEAKAEREEALKQNTVTLEGAKRGRRMAAIIAFFVLFIAGPLVLAPFAAHPKTTYVLTGVWIVLFIAAPIWLFMKIKLPADRAKEIATASDTKIGRINEHLRANRQILDEPLA
jgi:hypothetical protein